MGMIRKLTSITTAGMVGYRSPKEEQARLAKEQAKLARAQREQLTK